MRTIIRTLALCIATALSCLCRIETFLATGDIDDTRMLNASASEAEAVRGYVSEQAKFLQKQKTGTASGKSSDGGDR